MAERTRRSIWNGSISFGLVTIPIKLYRAVEPSVEFRLLCKEHLVAVSAYKEGSILTMLYYPDQILKMTEIPSVVSQTIEIANEERRIALDLNRMFAPKLKLDDSKDTFAEDVKKAVAERRGIPVSELKKEEEKTHTETRDLVNALKESIES